ncbi:MAG: LptA/OstA family protein [Armatimonadota bacterium]
MRYVLALAALLCAVVLFAQAPVKPEIKYTEVKYSADKSSYKWEGDDRVLALQGNVKFTQGDTTLAADKVDYRESTRTAVATGNLRIADDRSTITGDTCTVSFKEKKSTITGAVTLVIKPKAKDKSGLKDDATLTCQAIDYFYKEKRAVISSPLTLVQKDRTVNADSAVYQGEPELVELTGNVEGHDEKHTFSAPKVTVSLKEDNEWVEAEKATGTFYIKDE